jgi:hypothetical protein
MEGARERRRDQTSSSRPNNLYRSPLDFSPTLPQSWGWTRWTAMAVPHAAFQTPPPRLRIQLQTDTAAKASARAAAEHLLKRGRVHTLADVYACAYDRRLKQLSHLTVMLLVEHQAKLYSDALQCYSYRTLIYLPESIDCSFMFPRAALEDSTPLLCIRP